MKNTVTLRPEEVKDAVREYLERRGYNCGANRREAVIRFDVTSGCPDGPGTDGHDAGITKCVVDGVQMGKPDPKADCPDCKGKGYIETGNNDLPCERCLQ